MNLDWGQWSFNPSVRIDYFDFQYNDKLATLSETQTETEYIVSPNLNVLYNYSNNLQLYLKSGKGFHSNDTRVVVAQEGRKILPAAYGYDAGFIWKPYKQLLINTAYWYLFLEQEFVYVGDAGIVEPSGKTDRQGIDISMRYQPVKWLFASADANYAYARATEENEGEVYIPLAPNFTLRANLNVLLNNGFYGGLNLRHIDDRLANEDYSITAIGYTVCDLNLGFSNKSFNVELRLQNLFNTDWNEAQFATESRLQNEPSPVEEIHFTPGVPFNMRGKISYKF